MKILRISTRIYPDVSGPAKQVYLLSKFCSLKNIKIITISCIPKGEVYLKEKKVNDNFIIHYFPFHAPGINAGAIRLTFFFIKFLFFGIIKVIKTIYKEEIDLIHAHSPPPSGFIAYFFYKFFNVPYFYSIHGIEVPIQFISDLDINLIVKNSKKTFVVSRTLKKYLDTNYNVKNINWFPNVIQTKKYYHVNDEKEKDKVIKSLNLNYILQKEDFIISYIGYMFFEQKVRGMIDFLDSFYHFLNKINLAIEKEKIKLIFIGEGEYSTLLEERISKLKLSKNVFILGRRNDVKDILAISDLLALTSYLEGFPNVLLEAMAAKVPCLGTDVGEVKQIIGNTGFIVKPGDYINMERKIETFYRLSKNERLKLMEKAYNRVKKHFDININVNKLTSMYLKYRKATKNNE